MTASQYALGIALLLAVLGSLAVTSFSLRRMVLPTWSQAPARVAECVIGIATLVLVAELLGAVGWFRRWPVVLALTAVAVGATVIARRLGRFRRPGVVRAHDASDPAVRRREVVSTVGAAFVVFIALIPWLDHTLTAVHSGMREFDTNTYHMPFAVRFVQTGSLTGIQYDGNPPVSFYPLNSELIHAVGILLLGRDLLSPVLNLGWLGLALLAGWCIGRPLGASPATMSATALIASLRFLAFTQGGTAKNDIMALSLLLAAVALAVNGRRSRGATILAALAAGLAAGTRLNLWASALALAAVATATVPRDRRWMAAGSWALGIAIGSGFWYLRNLFATGNPMPWFGVKISGLLTLPSTSAPIDCGTTSVAHYLADPGFVTAHLVPQLGVVLGGRWWVVLCIAIAGVGAGLVFGRASLDRALAVVALVSGGAYLLTPATAGGTNASCFAFDTRFAAPALALAAIVLVLVLARRANTLIAIAACAILVLADASIPLQPAPVLVSAALAGGVAGLALRPWRVVPRAALAAGGVLVILAAAAAGWREQRIYLRDRYSQPRLEEPVEGVYAVLRHVSDARVAVTGFSEIYPFFGPDLSNRVELPVMRLGKVRFAPYSDCSSWLGALHRGRYGYVVTAAEGVSEPPAAAWTRAYPGAREVVASAPGAERGGHPWRWELFRLPAKAQVDVRAACRMRSAGRGGAVQSGAGTPLKINTRNEF